MSRVLAAPGPSKWAPATRSDRVLETSAVTSSLDGIDSRIARDAARITTVDSSGDQKHRGPVLTKT